MDRMQQTWLHYVPSKYQRLSYVCDISHMQKLWSMDRKEEKKKQYLFPL